MTKPLSEWAREGRELVDRTTAVVVGIGTARGRQLAGVAWDRDVVVTAAEALERVERVQLHGAAGPVDGTVVGADLATDVAVVRVGASLQAAPRADAGALGAGDAVIIAGREHGRPLVAWSHVQYVGPQWQSRRGGDISRDIRLAPPLDGSFEGAGVFNLDGELVAMAVPGPRRRALGIPVDTIARVVAALLERGYLPRPYLGLRLQPVWLDADTRARTGRGGPGVIVTGVEPGSPAEAAGVMFGDLLLTVAGIEVGAALQVTSSLARAAIGATITLEYLRAGVRETAAVVIGERPRA